MSVIGRVAFFIVGGGDIDADAATWKANVLLNGGTVPDATLLAASNYCVACKDYNIWTKQQRVNLMAGVGLAAALVPLKVGGGNSTDTNNNFLSGDYDETTGLKGNGTTKYLNTGVTLTNLGGNVGDNHLSFYGASIETSGGTNRKLIGAFINSSPFPGITLDAIEASTTRRYLADDSFLAGGNAAATISSGLATEGFISGAQTSTTATALYQNGSSVATSSNTAAAFTSTSQVYVLASNSGTGAGAAINYSAAYCRGYSLGYGMSPTDMANFYTVMQGFQTALGRQV